MKKILLSLLSSLAVMSVNAQTYTTSTFDLSNIISTSGSTSHSINQTLAVGESILINFTVGNLAPATGDDTNADTLFYPLKFNITAVNATDELQLKAEVGTVVYEVSRVGGGVLGFGEDYYVIENQTVPVLVTNTGTTSVGITSTKIFGGQYAEVISNAGVPLFGANGSATFTNPVEEDFLTIGLPSDVQKATIQLVSMTGDVLLQKEITQSENELDLSSLSSGIYLIRDESTASMAKLVLK